MKEVLGHVAAWMCVLLVIFSAPFVISEFAPSTRSIQECVESTVTVHIGEFGHGSGVYISPNCILTAGHVADNDESLSVELNDGTILEVKQVLLDSDDDLCFLYTEESSDMWIPMGSIEDVSVGDEVYLIGTPLTKKLRLSVTKGVLSHNDRFEFEYWKDVFQVDAYAALGNSGGPLIFKGKLVGICVGLVGSRAGSGLILCEPVDDIDPWLRSK
ncbi:MAG TPA: serine protease [Marinobacter sp.]|uniref:Serine protease n=1 Tax=marine sediment metagenome TaxID=412755 RepID=A0A0F9TCX8_9ZZZZ|nr:serine protease [Marinobacter sp.]